MIHFRSNTTAAPGNVGDVLVIMIRRGIPTRSLHFRTGWHGMYFKIDIERLLSVYTREIVGAYVHTGYIYVF